MKSLALHHPTGLLTGTVHLPLSKSECNRLLIISALSNRHFQTLPLSEAEDSQTLQRLIKQAETHNNGEEFNVGAAGTTMRFLTAYFAVTPGVRILTGSERMKERPIGELVNALRQLGASIEYTGHEGYPPLRITGRRLSGGEVTMRGDVSSQFITALLLIAPMLHNGLVIRFTSEVVSVPYINMTIRLMERYGATALWHDDVLSVSPQAYSAEETPAAIEPDWSAAAPWFAMAALAKDADILLAGLHENSLQGDRVLADLAPFWGLSATFESEGLRLRKTDTRPLNFAFDFEDCPDIAQSASVIAAALRIPTLLNGLQTLRIKETDRIAALQQELGKLNLRTTATNHSLEIIETSPLPASVNIDTYEDHRMAMAFAPLALCMNGLRINEPDVVRKSYPGFWDEMKKMGFEISA
ncbi:MAG: 3-phosphoshikimate 1-carboxyvinyltransferase [Bacteroidia bacterium]|jgi:3-phosphoshikimate 1-carboxyvinyltransferase|nr:3-phosphoshikimate 1-carboxyvinyltransferase [Bacteroidia bacterium]